MEMDCAVPAKNCDREYCACNLLRTMRCSLLIRTNRSRASELTPRWFTSSAEISKPSLERVGLARVLRTNSGRKSAIVRTVLIRISGTITVFLVRDMGRGVLLHEGLVSRFAVSSASDYVTSAFDTVKKGVRPFGPTPYCNPNFYWGEDMIMLCCMSMASRARFLSDCMSSPTAGPP